MARTNFTFEKRRKELERKKKKEAKRQAKLDKRAAAEQPVTTAESTEGAVSSEAEIPEPGAARRVLPS